MSRARNLKPGFFKNEELAECDPLARILFAGLWCEADRLGRLEDRPKKLKAVLLPFDDCDCNELLQQLAARGFIHRYQVDGVRFIRVLTFGKHQNPHVREPASTIPAPDEHSASPVLDLFRHENGPADPPFPLPPSPFQEKHVDADAPTDDGEDAPDRFEEFWKAYPDKTGKKPAREKWKQKRLDRIAQTVIDDVKRRAAEHGKWLDGYIPNPSTYLHQERWNDPIVPRRAAPPQAGGRLTQAAQRMAQRRSQGALPHDD